MTRGQLERALRGLIAVGYTARGLTYLISGWLGLLAALGLGGQTTGMVGAVRALVLEHTLGAVAAWAICAGLGAYCLARLIESALNWSSWTGWPLVERLGAAGSGVIYGGAAFAVARILVGLGEGRRAAPRVLTAAALEQPMGDWLVIVAGLVVSVISVSLVWESRPTAVERETTLDRRDGRWSAMGIWLIVVGNAGRAAVLLVTGVLVAVAGWTQDAGRAHGLGGTLSEMSQQPAGRWWLGLASGGLLLYALASFVQARWRRSHQHKG